MPRSVTSRWLTIVYGLSVAALAISGMAQMPIFKRYYLADIPGLGWLAEYYVTHHVHYVAALVLLVIVLYAVARFLMSWRYHLRLSVLGAARVVMLAILIGSGILRVLKNLPSVFLDPGLVQALDFIHIGAAVLLGLLALLAALTRRKPYLVTGPMRPR